MLGKIEGLIDGTDVCIVVVGIIVEILVGRALGWSIGEWVVTVVGERVGLIDGGWLPVQTVVQVPRG